MFYQEELPEESRTRRNQDIYALFHYLFYERGYAAMLAYKIVGYVFYLSADQIRKIIKQFLRIGTGSHNGLTKSPYFCTVFQKIKSMEQETLLEIEGYLTLNSNGALHFHDSAPYVNKTTVERIGNTKLPAHTEYSNWVSEGNFFCLGFKDKFPELEMSTEKPVPVKLQLV